MIINTTFSNAQMTSVSMEYSRIINGNFSKADLVESNWRNAYCEKCIFDQTNFTNADLSDAIFLQSDFRNCILTNKQLKQIISLENSIFSN
jgi:uncharacterized protein YjbI with pentapeptide repeats